MGGIGRTDRATATKVILALVVLRLMLTARGARLNSVIRDFGHVSHLSWTRASVIRAVPVETPGSVPRKADPVVLMTFTVFGTVYSLRLREHTDLVNSTIWRHQSRRVVAYTGAIESRPECWARISIYLDYPDAFRGVIRLPDDLIWFDLAMRHDDEPDTTNEARASMVHHSATVIAFRQSDKQVPSTDIAEGLVRPGWMDVLGDIGTRAVDQTVSDFGGLIPTIPVGMAFDAGYLGSDIDDPLGEALAILNEIDGLYAPIGVRFRQGPVHTGPSPCSAIFDQRPKIPGQRSCPLSIHETLQSFSRWHGACSSADGLSNDDTAGIWILFTRCFGGGAGPVGLGNTGHVCRKQTEWCTECTPSQCSRCRTGVCPDHVAYCGSATAVVTAIPGHTSEIAAHELAHLLGAHHTGPHEGIMGPTADWSQHGFTATPRREIYATIHSVMRTAWNCITLESADSPPF